MANRRMFSKGVIGSARFLKMPQSSRLLYYDLGMEADDDGIVEAWSVLRKTGANEDDLKVLACKGFIRILNEDLVSLITDWRENNIIRTDRYKQSIYAELVMEPDITTGENQVETIGKPNDNQWETQVRLGNSKDIKKESIEKESPTKRFVPPTVDEVRTYCEERGNNVDPQKFVDYYEASNWMRGSSTKIRDWKACVRTWEGREPRAKPTKFNFEQRATDYDAILRREENYDG